MKGITPLYSLGQINEDLEKYGMAAYKCASADLTNHDLLKHITTETNDMFYGDGDSNP